MTKRPSRNFNPDVTKTPKKIEEPANYKSCNVSWQFGMFDINSKWGLSGLQNLKFILHDEIYECNINTEIDTTLSNLDNSNFKNIESFFRSLIEKCSEQEVKITILEKIYKCLNFKFRSDIYSKLCQFEQKTWHEIEKEQYGGGGKTKHHSVEIDKLIKEARDRLTELKLDGIEVLFSLRLDGQKRIWGIRKFGFLQILWYDSGV